MTFEEVINGIGPRYLIGLFGHRLEEHRNEAEARAALDAFRHLHRVYGEEKEHTYQKIYEAYIEVRSFAEHTCREYGLRMMLDDFLEAVEEQLRTRGSACEDYVEVMKTLIDVFCGARYIPDHEWAYVLYTYRNRI